MVIVVGIVLAMASASPSAAPPDAADPDRPSWSSSSAQVARPRPHSEAEAPPLLAPALTGVSTVIGGIAGFAAGSLYAVNSTDPTAGCTAGCCGLLVGTAVGAATGTGVAAVVDHDVNPLAVLAAGVGAPVGAVMTWGALAYLTIPFIYGVALAPDDATNAIFGTLGVIAAIGGIGMGTAVAVAAVQSMRLRRPGEPSIAVPDDDGPPVLLEAPPAPAEGPTTPAAPPVIAPPVIDPSE